MCRGVLRKKTESSRLLCMPSLPCLAYNSSVLFGDDDRNTQRVQQMVASKFVVLTLGAFLQTVVMVLQRDMVENA